MNLGNQILNIRKEQQFLVDYSMLLDKLFQIGKMKKAIPICRYS